MAFLPAAALPIARRGIIISLQALSSQKPLAVVTAGQLRQQSRVRSPSSRRVFTGAHRFTVNQPRCPRHFSKFIVAEQEPAQKIEASSSVSDASLEAETSVKAVLNADKLQGPSPVLAGGGSDDGVSGGSKGSGRGGRRDDDESGNSGEGDEELAALLKENRPFSKLPEDIQAALKLGSIGVDELKRFFALEKTPLAALMSIAGFRSRLIADPKFLVKLGIEEVVGVTMKTIAEIKARQERFWMEAEFVGSDLALEICGDFALVWLLAPKLRIAEPKGFLAGLPANAFQRGSFSPFQRVAAFLYKAVQFFGVGFLSSVVGHSATVGLIELKQKLDPEFKPNNELASVMDTSVAWGAFMMISSNTRYQLVNAVETWMIDPLLRGNPALSAATSFVLRTGNTFWGGMQWIAYAKFIGLQKDAALDPVEEVATPAT